MTMERRVQIGSCVALNGGDAAILEGVHDAVATAAPGARITVTDAHPDVTPRYYPQYEWVSPPASLIGRPPRIPKLPRLSRRIWSRRADRAFRRARSGSHELVQNLRGLDAAVQTGGTYLTPEYFHTARLFEYELLGELGVPNVFYTQSIGDFAGRPEQARIRSALNDARLVLLRDARSRDNVERIGVDLEHVHVVGDAVFGTADDEVSFDELARLDELDVMISVRRWPSRAPIGSPEVRGFVREMARFVDRMVKDHGWTVTFRSTCQGIPEYAFDDSDVAAAVEASVNADTRAKVSVDRSFHTPAEFREHARGADLVIATRMHAAIQALCVGSPVLPIAYEFKTTELFQRFGLGDQVLDIQTFTASDLAEQACSITTPGTRETFARRLTDGVRTEVRAAHRAVDLLSEVLR